MIFWYRPPLTMIIKSGNKIAKYIPQASIALFFIFMSVLITFPLVLKFGSAIYGIPGDSTGTIWMFWNNAEISAYFNGKSL